MKLDLSLEQEAIFVKTRFFVSLSQCNNSRDNLFVVVKIDFKDLEDCQNDNIDMPSHNDNS